MELILGSSRAGFDFDHMGWIKFRYDLVSLLVFNLELNIISTSVGLDLFKTHELLVGWLKLVHITRQSLKPNTIN